MREMRFSSGALTTPTTTTPIDLSESAQGKRGSNSGMQAPAPIQIVEIERLNGGTPHQDECQPQTPASDNSQRSIAAVAITSPYSNGASQTLPDDEGNV